MTTSQSTTNNLGQQLLNKVPQITLFFWIIKVLCTTVGETFSDFLSTKVGFGLNGTSLVMGTILAIVLVFQFRSKRYTPALYWINIVLVSVFGTLVTDNLTDNFHLPLEASSIIFSVLLSLTFVFWYLKEKTLSIHSIFTRQREIFYWTTILFTFALGTATGDLLAERLGFGYLQTGIIISILIAIFTFAKRFGLNSILAFWLVYIMTRPLGASIGDYLSQAQKFGGLGLGTTITSIIFLGAILATVVYLTITKRDLTMAEVDSGQGTNMKPSLAIAQTGIVIVSLLALSGITYTVRQNTVDNSLETTTTTLTTTNQSKTLTNPKSKPNNSNTNLITNPTTKQPTNKQSKLGDLSTLQKSVQDSLASVNAGDFVIAQKRITDFETEWDSSEPSLKPRDSAKWTIIDGLADKYYKALRASNPDTAACKAALTSLLASLN